MDRTQIKLSAKQTLLNNFAKAAMPVWAGLLWSLIIGALIAILIVMFVVAWYIGLVLLLPVVLAIIMFVLNLKLRQSEYYLKVARGERLPDLKWFFVISGNFNNIWKIFKIQLLSAIYKLLLIFFPNYVATLFWFDDFMVVENTRDNFKELYVKIPRLTKGNVFELGLAKLSFFWWDFLAIITLGIANIFVSPYKNLTRAKIYNYMLDNKKQDDNLKNALKQMVATGQFNFTAQESTYTKQSSLDSEQFADIDETENEERLALESIKNQFDSIKNVFAHCEKILSKYFILDNNYKDIGSCENYEELLEILQDYTWNMNYSTNKQFEKTDCADLKTLLKFYKKLNKQLKQVEYNHLCNVKISKVVTDRISILEYEIMKIQKFSFETIFGSRVNKLKMYNKKYSTRNNAENFVENCNTQLKVEKRCFIITACVVLATFLMIIVMSIGISLGVAPLEEVSIDGVVYKKASYYGAQYYSVSETQNKNIIEIKEEVRGLPVKEIGKFAFSDCYSLTKVTIPSSVKLIGSSAFYNCSSLTSVILRKGLENIGSSAFAQCSSLKTITIPESVVNIGNDAFRDCQNLENVKFSNNSNLKTIGDYTFFNCINLSEIAIPYSLTNIGTSAFSNCTSLNKITLTNVKIIRDNAFYCCMNLTEIVIPKSVTSMGYNVFKGCEELTIQCEVSYKPSGWNSYWNGDCPVEWGYVG